MVPLPELRLPGIPARASLVVVTAPRATAPRARLWLGLAAAFAVASCSDATGPAFGPPANVQIVSEPVARGTVALELPLPLILKVTDASGRAVPGVAVQWTVAAGAGTVASAPSVTDNGGVAQTRWTLGPGAGEQAVDARAGTLTAVRFIANADAGPVDRVVVLPDSVIFTALADTARVSARAEDAYGNVVDTPIAWSTADPNIVAIDGSGRITATGNGSALLTASSSGRSASLVARVTQLATTVRLTSSADTINALTHTRQLELAVLDRNDHALSAPNVAWMSLDPDIAAVGADGRVRALTTGTARVRVSVGSVADTAHIHIRQIVAAVTVSPATVALQPAEQITLAATATDSAGSVIAAAPFTWESSASDVAAVNASGVVTAHAAGTAAVTVRATADPARSATATVTVTIPSADACTGAGALTLELPLGGHIRRSADGADAPRCLFFDATRASGQQYLVLFENMPLTGGYGSALFPGITQGPTSFAVSINTGTPASGAPPPLASALAAAPAGTLRTWDFGAGPIYEAEVSQPTRDADPMLLRAGRQLALQSVATPALGDTMLVYLEGIPRLSIPSGQQRVVIRFISDDIMIAEDARLQTTLTRQNGSFNTPLSQQTMAAIATEYATYAKVQGDALFADRHNADVESTFPRRVLAVHTLMSSDNIWGYTYSSGNYFVWDYWVATNGSIAGVAQLPQVVADNLFMHEIAHMRHWGMLERAGRTFVRGNRWLVEGFARFSERLPIAARLLGTQTPARTGNVVLPRNPAFNNSYYRNDVPTYLNAGLDAFAGYDNASYFFDYFADQTAFAGAEPLAALRDVVVHAGTLTDVNAAVARWLPDLTLGDVMTRARIALYADDAGTIASVPWTQYLQFQLRASRPAGSASGLDPVNLWPKILPGAYYNDARSIATGGAWGYLIDGTTATTSAPIRITADAGAHGVISVTRVR